MATIAETLVEQDIEHENSARVVWTLAWPAVALNSLQVVNTLLDRGFIGHLPGAALTAHGGATNVMFMMFSLAMALATGATALVSRAFGANDHEELRRASQQALRLAIMGGIAIAAITAGIAPMVANFILPRSDQDAIHLMIAFLVPYALGMPAIFIIQTLAGALRGIGDTKSPMVISGIQIFLHITLNFLLVFPTRTVVGITVPGAGWGLVGGAAALAISATISAFGYIYWVGRTPLGNLFSVKLPEWSWTKRILKIAIPAGFMAVLRVLSLTMFTLVLAMVPNSSIAIGAMSTGFALESVMFMPAFGLSAASGALVGQSLGMKRPDRAERLAWTAGHHAAIVTICLAGPIFLGAHHIAAILLENKPEMIDQAALLLRYLCSSEVLFAYAMVMIGAMQGAGDTVRPMWISIFSLWGLRVPLAFFLALPKGQVLFTGVVMPLGLGLGAVGGWMSMSFTQGIQGILALILFKKGDWKTKKV